MSTFEVQINGVVVRADSADAVMELIDTFRRRTRSEPSAQPTLTGLSQPATAPVGERVVKFIQALYAAGRSGVEANELAQQIGVDGARGLGGFVGQTNRLLVKHDVRPSRVWTNRRVGDERRWYGGPDLGEAIVALRIDVANSHERG